MNDFPETTDAIINADDNIETNTGSNVISASNETNENADLNSNLNSNINVNSNTDQLITIESLQAQIQKDQNEISQKETKVAKLKSLLTIITFCIDTFLEYFNPILKKAHPKNSRFF